MSCVAFEGMRRPAEIRVNSLLAFNLEELRVVGREENKHSYCICPFFSLINI